MILYHVSGDLNMNGEFTARVPDEREGNEDGAIPRICVSSSLEGCFSAMPKGFDNLEYQFKEHGSYFKVFKFDSSNLDEGSILCPDYLVKSGLVSDALLTGEHWILKDLTVSKENTEIISVQAWDYKEVPLGNSINLWGRVVYPSVAVFSDMKIIREIAHTGEEIIFKLTDYENPRTLINVLSSMFDFEIVRQDISEVLVRITSDETSLTEAFLWRGNRFRELYKKNHTISTDIDA